jgi:hypothetical protein
MRMDTFIRRWLGLKAHTVVKVEEREAEGERELLVYVERLGQRHLRCGVCGLQAKRMAPTRRPATAGWSPSKSSPECCAPIWPACWRGPASGLPTERWRGCTIRSRRSAIGRSVTGRRGRISPTSTTAAPLSRYPEAVSLFGEEPHFRWRDTGLLR